MCEYDSTWESDCDADEPAGESQTRRACQDKNKSSGWTLVTVRASFTTPPNHDAPKSRYGGIC